MIPETWSNFFRVNDDPSDTLHRRNATSPPRKARRHFPTDRPGLLPSDEHTEELFANSNEFTGLPTSISLTLMRQQI